MLHITAVILCTLIGFSKADYCQDNFTMGELPKGILVEAISLVVFGTLENFLGCHNDNPVQDNEVNLWYYSKNNPTIPVLLDKNNPTQVDPTQKTIILVPGWLCNVTNDRMPQLRDAYLTRYPDANIIGIDWTARSIDLYSSSYCGIPGVAKIIGRFLCNLNASLNVDLNEVHMVGHSMGAQISGLTGSEVQKQCKNKIGRITGLDPAGPLYQLDKSADRLDETDANFVDVIHTNMAFLGYWGQCGAVDFYPNCGTYQPGCLEIGRDFNITALLNLPLSVVGCNHLRSVDYMVESIISGGFTSESCHMCPGAPIIGSCIPSISPSKVAMGEDCPPNPEKAKYKLKTNSKAPFSKG